MEWTNGKFEGNGPMENLKGWTIGKFEGLSCTFSRYCHNMTWDVVNVSFFSLPAVDTIDNSLLKLFYYYIMVGY